MPAPANPVPIYLGGASQLALRRAARLAQGWIGAGNDIDEVPGLLQALGEYRSEYGRDSESFETVIAVNQFDDLDALKRLEEQGMTSTVFGFANYLLPLSDKLRQMEDRMAEQKLLPLAQERGIATMINRPYQRGALFGKSRGHELPALAAELDCNSWGQFYLKFILGHPAVTCVIPATGRVKHMVDNMQANFGRVPDAAQRKAMLKLFESL